LGIIEDPVPIEDRFGDEPEHVGVIVVDAHAHEPPDVDRAGAGFLAHDEVLVVVILLQTADQKVQVYY